MLYGEGGSCKWGQLIVKPQAGVVVEHQGYRYGVQLKDVSLISVASSWVMIGHGVIVQHLDVCSGIQCSVCGRMAARVHSSVGDAI